MSRVCINTGSSKEFKLGFKATMYCSGSCFSQFGRFLNRDQRVGEVSMAVVSSAAVIVEEIESDSYTSSTNNAAK